MVTNFIYKINKINILESALFHTKYEDMDHGLIHGYRSILARDFFINEIIKPRQFEVMPLLKDYDYSFTTLSATSFGFRIVGFNSCQNTLNVRHILETTKLEEYKRIEQKLNNSTVFGVFIIDNNLKNF